MKDSISSFILADKGIKCEHLQSYAIYIALLCTYRTGANKVEYGSSIKTSGPGCSKLTTSLVNVSLKFQTPIFFVEKM